MQAQIAHKLTTGGEGGGVWSKYFIHFQACAGIQGLAYLFFPLLVSHVSISSVNLQKRGSSDWRSPVCSCVCVSARSVGYEGKSLQRLSRVGVEVLIKI